MVVSNVPTKKHITFSGGNFFIGDYVRIQYKDWKGGVIGVIDDIYPDSLEITSGILVKKVLFSEIEKLKKVPRSENFNTVPYYDEEDKEFWRTHWITPEGIKEKTEEDLKILEELYAKKML